MIPAARDVVGPAGAPVIVFVHGTSLTKAFWRAVATRLAGTYRCVAVDLPGHGALAGLPFTLEAAADVVEAALDAEGAPRGVLVGLSLGGFVVITAAARTPGRVRGLVLAGSTAEPAGSAAPAFRLFAWALRVLPRRPVDAMNTWFFRHRYPPEIAEPLVAGGYWPRSGAIAVGTLQDARFHDRLVAYGGPVLVINGDLDFVFRLGERAFLRGVPNVTRRIFRWTSHHAPLDRPAAFAEAVRRFMERLPA